MVETKQPSGETHPQIYRRWLSVMYAAFALALLLLATIQRSELFVGVQSSLVLLVILIIATVFTAVRVGRGRALHISTVVLLAVDAIAALGLVAATGGYDSSLWVGLLLVSTAAPLLLPERWAAGMLIAVWLSYGLFLFGVPREMLSEMLLAYLLRVVGIALIALVLHRALSSEETLRLRAERREHVLHEFLELSARIRVSNGSDAILEEVARTVQSGGDFNCVTLNRIDSAADTFTVVVAYGASGRRLTSVEGLSFPWDQFSAQLCEPNRVGTAAYRLETLPFRSLHDEQHLVLPIISQKGIEGMLTVSNSADQQAVLDESQLLLELLANQASAVIDNSSLYANLEQRVADATVTITQSREDLAAARDRAETLYQIVRTLARTLDEREVITESFTLVREAIHADWGGILLLEPNTGHLAIRTGCEGLRGPVFERLQEMCGLVIAQRRVLVVDDTRQDVRWPSGGDENTTALLLVPMVLDTEPLGALVLGSRTPGAFSADHAQLALAASGQIAVAFSKAQLYRYTSEQSEQLSHTLLLREAEISKNQALLHSIGEGVVLCDRLDRITMINPAAEDMLAIKAEAFQGRRLSELPGVLQGPSDDKQSGYEQLSIGSHTLRAHFTPVLSSMGEQLGTVVVYHDITREVMTDKLKSTFLATASHELRTPLTSIRGYVDLLLLGTIGPLTQPQRDFLKVVKHNVGQLVDLIDDILDVSKVEAGEVRLRRAMIDPGELIYEVAESLYTGFAEKSIALALDVAPDLPMVMADRQRIRQVVVNLLGNACKYTPEGGKVDVLAYVQNEEFRVDVRDTGVGIASEAQPYIFTPFFRADNPLRDAAGGTGLGLSITKTLVELHGGRIWFDSSEGDGSTFSFALPLQGYEWSQPEWLEEQV